MQQRIYDKRYASRTCKCLKSIKILVAVNSKKLSLEYFHDYINTVQPRRQPWASRHVFAALIKTRWGVLQRGRLDRRLSHDTAAPR